MNITSAPFEYCANVISLAFAVSVNDPIYATSTLTSLSINLAPSIYPTKESFITAEVSKRINRIVSLGDKATIKDYLK